MDYSFNLDDMLKKTNVSTKKDFSDERFYKLTRDKDGKGSAVIRLLPDSGGIPFIQSFSHSIKVTRNGKTFWYIEDCPKTVDNAQSCPVCERWAELYNQGKTDESRFYNRTTQIVSNILVVKDTANPENEGKVFLYKFSRTLHKRIFRDMWEVSSEALEMGVEPVNMYDPVNGYNILLQCVKDNEKGMITYEPTKVIEKAVDVTNGDVEALMSKTHPLSDFINISSYKSYDTLHAHLEYVVDGKEKTSATEKHTNKGDENVEQKNEEKVETKAKASEAKVSEEVEDDDIEAILAELDG